MILVGNAPQIEARFDKFIIRRNRYMADTKKNPLLGAFRVPPAEDKPPAGPAATPPEPAEEKAPVEPPKEAAPAKGDTPPGEDKAKDGKPPAAPAKAGEEKKPTEPPKAPEGQKPGDQGKETKGDKAPVAPAKAGEEKKPAEPPKETEELDKDGIPKDFSMEIVPKDKLGQVTKMATAYIDDFEGHPFPVRDDEDMAALVESIKQVGILEPATIIRNPKKPGRFEMVAGHRRMHAAKLAGLDEIPVIVRDMDHDEATIYMVDSNLKREKPLTPMEKARAYTMRAEALKRKTGRRSKAEIAALEASGEKPLTADEEIAKQTGESKATVQRLKTLTKLTPPLQDMVDKGKIPVNTAADIAQMKPKEQKALADAMAKEAKVPSGTKAKELKEASKAGTLTKEKIEAAVAPTKREVEPPLKVTLMEEDLLPYFPRGTTVPDVKKGIFEGLEVRKKLIERQKAKAKEEKEGKKKPSSQAR